MRRARPTCARTLSGSTSSAAWNDFSGVGAVVFLEEQLAPRGVDRRHRRARGGSRRGNSAFASWNRPSARAALAEPDEIGGRRLRARGDQHARACARPRRAGPDRAAADPSSSAASLPGAARGRPGQQLLRLGVAAALDVGARAQGDRPRIGRRPQRAFDLFVAGRGSERLRGRVKRATRPQGGRLGRTRGVDDGKQERRAGDEKPPRQHRPSNGQSCLALRLSSECGQYMSLLICLVAQSRGNCSGLLARVPERRVFHRDPLPEQDAKQHQCDRPGHAARRRAAPCRRARR